MGPNRAVVVSLTVRVLLTHFLRGGTQRLPRQPLIIWALEPPGSGEASVLALRRFTQPFKPLASPDIHHEPAQCPKTTPRL